MIKQTLNDLQALVAEGKGETVRVEKNRPPNAELWMLFQRVKRLELHSRLQNGVAMIVYATLTVFFVYSAFNL